MEKKMFFTLIPFSCIFLYGSEATAPQTYTPPTIPKLHLPALRQGETERTESPSPSSEELSLVDKQDAEFFASWDDFQLDNGSPIQPRSRWSIPFQVGQNTLPKKSIQLPNVGTPEEIEERKREYEKATIELVQMTKKRSIEILHLRVTEPQKP
jgi:hypothetical protein